MPNKNKDWTQAPPDFDSPPRHTHAPLTTSEFAEITGRSPEMVRRWLRQGRLPTAGQNVRYPADQTRGARPGEKLIPYSALVEFRARRRGVRHDRRGRLVRGPITPAQRPTEARKVRSGGTR